MQQSVRIDEAGLSRDHIDPVAGHLILDDLNFVLDDMVGAEGEIFDRDRLLSDDIRRRTDCAGGTPRDRAPLREATLLGMVPVLMQTPPTTSLRSMMPTFLPSLAAWTAAFWPAGPVPMTSRS